MSAEKWLGYHIQLRWSREHPERLVYFRHTDQEGKYLVSPDDAKVVLRPEGNEWILQEYRAPKYADIRLKRKDYIEKAREIAVPH
jgi:hypothetical protein